MDNSIASYQTKNLNNKDPEIKTSTPGLFSLIIIFFFSVFITNNSLSQGLVLGLSTGLNVGTPYGVAEKGAGGALGMGPAIGIYVQGKLNMKWDVRAQFLYSKKTSIFRTPVSGDTIYEDNKTNPEITYYWPTIYRGWVEGKFDNTYLDIPVIFYYKLNEKWYIGIGPQFSYLLKGINNGTADIEVGDPESPFTTVTDQPFDQSKHLNKWDYGIQLGSIFKMKSRIFISLNLTTGLNSVYKKNYKYIDRMVRNIYLRASIAYRISDK